MMMTMRSFLSLLLCFTATPSSQYRQTLAFKSTSIQTSYGSSGSSGVGPNGNTNGGGNAYRRPHNGRHGSNNNNGNNKQGGSCSRSQISIHQDSSCIVRLAATDDEDSSTSIADNVERRFSAASTEKDEILIASGNAEDIDTTPARGAVTSTVNERLLSEIQASVNKEKYGSGKNREYFKEFRSQKTEEERQRSIEEARDLNGEY